MDINNLLESLIELENKNYFNDEELDLISLIDNSEDVMQIIKINNEKLFDLAKKILDKRQTNNFNCRDLFSKLDEIKSISSENLLFI